MKTQDIHNLSIAMGMEADFRGRDGVQKLLDSKKSQYLRLSLKEQDEFDRESLENPYMDSGVCNVSDDKDIKRVLVGIDIGPSEILLAKQLGNIDLVISHHPVGKGLAQLHDVMDLQADVYNYYGVPINVAEGMMRERISEVARGVSAYNHQRTVDAARLMGINLMAAHTTADNLAAKFLKSFIESRKFEKVAEILEALKQLPEYKEAMKIGVGPTLFTGAPENRCGKIALTEITGGTEGSPKLYEKLAQAGVGTVIGMHLAEEHKKKAEAAHINVVIAGHMSSDSLGMNLLIDELEKQGIEVVACSGFTRFSRVKK
ncbi:NGG1p interacting factor NIF3 [Candidatus Parcubacteria bacterium]|nr:NGG1p interacting factor NIF3 [Candidatus Parcubacteria bacterium]